MTLCITAVAVFISGYGSDKDDNAKSEPPAPQRTTTQAAENFAHQAEWRDFFCLKFVARIKKIFMTLFMAAALIFISGCGSDSSDKATSSAPKVWFNADTFTKRYNTAIDFVGETMNKDFSSLKIADVKTIVFSDGESARLIVVKSDKYNDGVTGYGNFLPLPLDDKDVWQAGYSGAYHGNESSPPVGNYAILYAVIKAFPELDDLNTDEIFSRLMDKNKNNAQVTLEENGLRVEAKRFFDDLSVTVTNI